MQGFTGRAPIQVDDELIRISCETLDDALRMCLHVSGRALKEVAWDCGWRDGGRVLKRILAKHSEGADRRYMPHEKLVPFMVACRNVVPWRWLGMQLLPEGLEGNAEKMPHEVLALRAILTEVRDEVQALREMKVGGTSFSLGAAAGIPEWLICEVERVQGGNHGQ